MQDHSMINNEDEIKKTYIARNGKKSSKSSLFYAKIRKIEMHK